MDYVFLFDLDSTITREEILPKISIKVNKDEEMRRLTEATMQGDMPFEESFTNRVQLLMSLPVDQVQDIVADVLLNDRLVKFIKENKDRCYIVTGNLDVWIHKLLEKIDMLDHCFCSKAIVEGNSLVGISRIINKKQVVSEFTKPTIVVGDGSNDADMMSIANFGIGFGAVREIAPAVVKVCTHAVYDENKLVEFLGKFV